MQGRFANGTAVFKGIAFAAPPDSALRWREPQPVEKWTAIPQADTAGPSRIQKPDVSLDNGGDPGKLDEDGLYLNVFGPVATPEKRRPLLVWIHGGALIFGSGALSIDEGSALARRDIVVVTINHRLGALGSFSNSASGKSNKGGPVNFGLLDQVAALR